MDIIFKTAENHLFLWLADTFYEVAARRIACMLNDDKPNMRILVVDDDETTRTLMRILLVRAGYEVTLAIDGMHALALLAEGLPDLVISDVMMPNLDGFRLLGRVRADPRMRTLPVILLTAKTTMDDIIQGMGLGADDYLAKPFEVGDLLKRIRAKLALLPVSVE
jgi:DNA-binding response OmpR family regulator